MNGLKFAFFALASVFAVESSAELRVTEEGPQRLRLIWEPEGPELEHGRGALVGLPPDGDIRLELIEARVARTDRADEGAETKAGPVVLGRRSFARRQRVAELALTPRISADGTRTLYDRVVVDLHLVGAAGTRIADSWGEDFYSRALVNPDQSRNWRLPQKRRPARKTALESGTWLRVFVREEGMYRITGAELAEMGVALEQIEPASLTLRYGGGKALNLRRIDPPQILAETGLVVEDGGDGRFDAEDFVLFWAEPVNRWEYNRSARSFEYRKNLYVDENVYWLGFGTGEGEQMRADNRSGTLEKSEPHRPTSYRVRVHEEAEQFILAQTYGIKSGYNWYWEDFRGNARNFPLVVRDAAAEPVDIRFGFFGIVNSKPSFEVHWNDESVGGIGFGSKYAVAELQTTAGPEEGLNQLGLFHTNSDPARFDYYELEYSRGFSAERGELIFTYPLMVGFTEFSLSGFADEVPRVFEVSQGLVEIVDFVYDAQAGSVVFQDRFSSVPRKYAVSGPSARKRPTRIEVDESRWLLNDGSGADWVAIYHGDFRAAAERLARWRAEDDRFGTPLRAMAIDVQDIYDQFSGGLLDPAAIRNFLAYTMENWDPMPMFVTLIGDGSYDYKNNSGTSPGNWIPPFQDRDSTYDGWYVRVMGADALPDMAIGRLTVQTEQEANIVVDKLIEYDRDPERGAWQSRVVLVSDDLSNPDHPQDVEAYFIIDSEFLAQRLMPDELDLVKLYIADFPLEGRTKPRARDEFIRLFNQGALILTYLGHGNPTVLAHESMFLVSRDLGAIENEGRLPFFYTAASQIGVFDDPARISMPEALLKKDNGGVIGMISATRVGYHNSNMILANQFHEQMYQTNRKAPPIGQAFMEAKQLVLALFSASDLAFRNMQRYSIFGDPATRLAVPRFQVQISIADSLSALGEVEVEGQVLDMSGNPAAGYQGQVWLQAFDSSARSRLDGFNYEQVGAHIFRGRFPVVDGRFGAEFRVPKDITYGGKDGRISAYVWSDSRPSAFGAVDGLVLSGTASGVETDLQGPEISLSFEGADGTTIPSRTVLLATITDPSGINITGDTGHEIELMIDGKIFALTDFYSVQGGDYRQGLIQFPMPELEPGNHELRLKVWDSFNNSSRTTLAVTVREEANAGLEQVLFHPNPIRAAGGHFTYVLKDNVRAVQIRIFSLSGRLVDELEGQTNEGYNQVPWIPAADLANGTYLYSIAVERNSGARGERRAALQIAK